MIKYKTERTHRVWMNDLSIHSVPWRGWITLCIPHGLCYKHKKAFSGRRTLGLLSWEIAYLRDSLVPIMH